MSDTLKYKGYHGSVEYSQGDECLHGRILGISDIISYEGNSLEEIKTAFTQAVDDYLSFCEESGREPNRPYSGKVMFRIDPAIHAKAALAAELAGKSLNQWAEEVLAKAAR